MDAAPQQSFRRDARVIGLVGVVHAISHFLQLALPPLFPILRAEFDVSWSLLGALVSLFYGASGLSQLSAGFLVDRVGARPMLFGGLGLLAGGVILASFVPDVYWLFPVVVLMGLGNGVFHPVDFAILNASVTPRRLGHAYSSHGIGGNLGFAIAPVVSFGLATLVGWRGALGIMGVVGLVVLGILATQRHHLQSQRATDAQSHTLRSSIALFTQASILACFAYFVVQTMAFVGMQTLGASALNAAFDVSLAIANSAVTAFLLGSSAGILAGGFIAAHTARHDRVAATGLLLAAMLTALVYVGPPMPLLLPVFAAIGFAVGATSPSRDLIVRNVTPKGATGRVYGFVYSGLDIGATVGPLWFGFMLDQALGRELFLVFAALLLIAIGTVVQAGRLLQARPT